MTLGVLGLVRLSRPHFLLGGALMYAMGVASGTSIAVGTYLLGQAMVTTAQLTAHYVNEYSDVEADRLVVNRTFFSGGSGVLAEESASPRVALRLALISSTITVISVVLVAFISLPAALLGFVALGVSWAYSMPPVRLLSTGWGELATSLVVTIAVPIIGVLITGSVPGRSLLTVSAILLPIHMAMMLVFEIPDLASDRIAAKTVLAVRIGESKTLGVAFALYVVAALIWPVFPPFALTFNTLLPVGAIYFLLVGDVLFAIGRRAFGWATSFAVLILVLVGSLFTWLFLIT